MITSTSNSTIKAIRKLRDRKERYQQGSFYAEGLRIIGEAFDRKAEIEMVLFCTELLSSTFGLSLIEKMRASSIPCLEVDRPVFEAISLKENPQGLGAVIKQKWSDFDGFSISQGKITVALDSVADPGNLGTIMRTLDAVGGEGIILLDQSTDPYDPTCVRSSMGSLFNLKIIKCSFSDFAKWAMEQAMPIIGTSGSATVEYHCFDYPSQMILLMGSERQGLGDHHYEICSEVVKVPMTGGSDSLNLAIATAAILFEVINQFHGRPVWCP